LALFWDAAPDKETIATSSGRSLLLIVFILLNNYRGSEGIPDFRERYRKTAISPDADQRTITVFMISQHPVPIPHAGNFYCNAHRRRQSDLYLRDLGHDREAINNSMHESLKPGSLRYEIENENLFRGISERTRFSLSTMKIS